MSRTAADRGGGSRRKLRTQVATAFGFTAALAFISLGVLTWAFDRQIDARRQIVDRIDPAALAARDVLASLVDQETGVRGYALSRDEQFLAPYEAGLLEERAAMRRLRALVRGEGESEVLAVWFDAVAY